MKQLLRFFKAFITDCGAVVTVEFLVSLPLLFGAFVIAYEFGRTLWAFNVMTSDVESGLRYLTHTQGGASDVTAATNLVETGSTTGTANKSPWSWAVPSPTISVTSSTVSTGFNQTMTVFTMSTAVPVTLPWLDFIKVMSGNSVTLAYTLRVSDQASCLAGQNPATPCQPN